MIVSMIRLQARGSAAAEDYTVIARRIEALQLLYQELSETGVSSTFRDEVPLGAYVSRIAAAVGHLDGGQGIRVNVIAEEVMVDATHRGPRRPPRLRNPDQRLPPRLRGPRDRPRRDPRPAA